MRPGLLFLLIASSGAFGDEPPFAEYVRDTADFRWRSQADGRQLEVTSQNWHGAVWTHTVNLTLPADPTVADLAVVFVNGGADIQEISRRTGVACASVGGIYPACHGQTGGEGIALHALRECERTGDPTWNIAAATTKALVRTMDAIEASGKYKRFILTGFSKMGLACWWAAVMDSRVVGIIPVGADMLNASAQIAVRPKLFPQAAAVGVAVFGLVDPYPYRAGLRTAKFVISGTNDEHYDVTSVGSFWDGLPEPKWRLHLSNATHGVEPSDPRTAAASIAFIRALAGGTSLPRVESKVVGTTYRVTSEPPARTAKLWTTATSGEFKFAKWLPKPMTQVGSEGYAGEVVPPATGRMAVFAELQFDDFNLTTGITVIP